MSDTMVDIPKCDLQQESSAPDDLIPVHNDLLCFIQNYLTNSNTQEISELITHKCSSTDIRSAVETLSNWVDVDCDDTCEYTIDGLINIWNTIVLHKRLACVFYAIDIKSLPLQLSDHIKTQPQLMQRLTLQMNHNKPVTTDEQGSNTSVTSDVHESSSLLYANNTNTSSSIAASSPESPANELKSFPGSKSESMKPRSTPTSSLELAVMKIRKRLNANNSEPIGTKESSPKMDSLCNQFSSPAAVNHKSVTPNKRGKRAVSSDNNVDKNTSIKTESSWPNVNLAQLLSAANNQTSPNMANALFPNLANMIINAQSANPSNANDTSMQTWLFNYYRNLCNNMQTPKTTPNIANIANLFPQSSLASASPVLARKLLQQPNQQLNQSDSGIDTTIEGDTEHLRSISPDDSASIIDNVVQREMMNATHSDGDNTDTANSRGRSWRRSNSHRSGSGEGDGKPYCCDHPNCSKTFANKFLLKKHIYIHTGERPHECPFCHKRFNRKDNLLRHKKTHLANALQPSTRRRHSTVFGVNPFSALAAQQKQQTEEGDQPIDCSVSSSSRQSPALELYNRLLVGGGEKSAQFTSMMEKMMRESVNGTV